MALTKQQIYNAERKVQNEWAKKDFDKERMIEEVHKESIDRMQKQIDDFYLSYANRTGLTRAEANKRIKDFDVPKWAEKAAKAVEDKDFSPETNEWLKTYNSKMYISRVELLKAELELELQNMYAQDNAIIDKHGEDIARAEFKRQAGILGNSSQGSAQRIRDIVDADFYGTKFSQRIWGRTGYYKDTRKELFGSLNRIYTDMNGYKSERARIMKLFQATEYEAMRLLRTESARIRADSTISAMEYHGATHYIFHAERGACRECLLLDGVAVPLEKMERGVTIFPLHPNCRCSVHSHIEMKYKTGASTLDGYTSFGIYEKYRKAEANDKNSGHKANQVH